MFKMQLWHLTGKPQALKASLYRTELLINDEHGFDG
jgi:hypothetical protein